jgi:hypothetical protein
MNIFLKFALPVVGALSFAGVANAVVVPGVYNTGLGVGGAALAAGDGQVDANYIVTSSTNAAIVPGSHALTYYNPAYLMDGPLSRIVNATGDGNGGTGETTTFATTFSLLGFDSLNATLSGQALFDNSGEIFLNGNQVGGTISGFGTLAPFGTNANFFNAGLNTLSFTLHNVSGPEAFQVAGLTVTAARIPVVGGVPEPRSWALFVVGFGMVGATMRRRTIKTVAA